VTHKPARLRLLVFADQYRDALLDAAHVDRRLIDELGADAGDGRTGCGHGERTCLSLLCCCSPSGPGHIAQERLKHVGGRGVIRKRKRRRNRWRMRLAL
jgi:hypothetical protein